MSDEHAREQRAAQLKERIYVSFTALAVVIALAGHGEVTASEALVTLSVTVAGTLLAILVADIVSHIVVHERMMTRQEFGNAVKVSVGAVGVIVLPVLFLAFAAFDVWETAQALRAAAIALIAALVVIGYFAIRRLRLRWWQRIIALAAEAAVGVGVIALELLAHG